MSDPPREEAPEAPLSEQETAPYEVEVDCTPIYLAGRFITSSYLRLFHRLRVEGREHIPAEGGAMILSNHQSFLDIPVIAACTRRHVCFVARETLARSKFLAFMMRQSRAILIKRGRADRAALRDIVEHLKKGDLVTVYPEGTRTKDGSLGEFKGGALVGARKAGVPVIPAGIRGAIDAMPRGVSLPRPRTIGVRLSAPLDSSDPDVLEKARVRIAEMVGDGHYAALDPS